MINWITPAKIMAARPCRSWTMERVQDLFGGRKRVRLTTALRDRRVTPEDRFWVLGNAADFDDRTLRLLAADLAEGVLPLFKRRFPDDGRPRRAIETARRYAPGGVTREELETAGEAAWAAGKAAAKVAGKADAAAWAARAAAWAAAGDADWAAAGDAAWEAAEDAAEEAAWAARAAAGEAARAAARKTVYEALLEHAVRAIIALEKGEEWPSTAELRTELCGEDG